MVHYLDQIILKIKMLKLDTFLFFHIFLLFVMKNNK
jgi:hypothetical protein